MADFQVVTHNKIQWLEVTSSLVDILKKSIEAFRSNPLVIQNPETQNEGNNDNSDEDSDSDNDKQPDVLPVQAQPQLMYIGLSMLRNYYYEIKLIENEEIIPLVNKIYSIYKYEFDEYEKTLNEENKVSFNDLILYYRLGKVYRFRNQGCTQFGILVHKAIYTGASRSLQLQFRYAIYDHIGKVFRYNTNNIYIKKETYLYAINELHERPMQDNERENAINLGKKYVELIAKPLYKTYTGSRFVQDDYGNIRFIYSSGRIMIDDRDEYGKVIYRNEINSSSIPILTDDIYILFPRFVIGYALQRNTGWGNFLIENITENKYREDSFDCLKLEDDNIKQTLYKILSAKRTSTFKDIIDGKSMGLVFLLNGSPGTGKTLTAEATAEILHQPLYKIGFGELGCTPETIETNLKEVMDIATRWNAIVLIDEADVIMGTRNDTNGFLINAITSIFLKHIETYEGIIFLTTNRDSSIDPAFNSRISIKMNYKIDNKMNHDIWKRLLSNVKTILKDEELDDLVNLGLNGRQITNIIKLASYTSIDGIITKDMLMNAHKLANN